MRSQSSAPTLVAFSLNTRILDWKHHHHMMDDKMYLFQQSLSCPNCDQTLTSTFHQCQDSDHMCDNFCQHTSDQITQELITIFTFDPFMGPHNEKCDWQKEKGKNVHLRLIEFVSSDEDKERERKYLNRKYCFCYDGKRLFDFKL